MDARFGLIAEGLPVEVGGLMSTRRGGVSSPPFDSLNLRPSTRTSAALQLGWVVRSRFT